MPNPSPRDVHRRDVHSQARYRDEHSQPRYRDEHSQLRRRVERRDERYHGRRFDEPQRTGFSDHRNIAAQEHEEDRTIENLMLICRLGTLDQIIAQYETTNTLLDSLPLQRDHTRQIVSAVHYKLRSDPMNVNKSDPTKVFAFVERLVRDIKRRMLPPHPAAHVHLLGIYKKTGKFSEGCAFWQWLAQKDQSYADAAVYGAAIELLAYQGATSLPELEELYAHALKLFPGTFAQYHLSPDAVVADRAQRTTITGLPMTLLQGITTARIFSRDWKRSYLALDTVLRLYPTSTPPRFFELFMYERPTNEAYTVFLMACRSGTVLAPHHLTNLLGNLGKSAGSCAHFAERVTVLQAMADSIYAHLEAGGQLHGQHVGAFFTGFARLLPKLAPGVDYAGDEAVIRDGIAASAIETVDTLISAGMTRAPEIFTSLVSLSSAIKAPILLEHAINDVGPRVHDIGEIGRRQTLLAAGQMGNLSLMENYWNYIVTKAENQGTPVSYADWVTLARACKRANHPDFLHKQLQRLSHTVAVNTHRAVMEAFEERTFNHQSKSSSSISMSPEDFDSHMTKFKDQIQNIATIVMSKQPLDLGKTPLSMYIDPTRQPLASTPDMRAVYDELSIDRYQPRSPVVEHAKQSPKATSTTGIPLDELRFQNWVAIMELMNEADAVEHGFQQRMNKAIRYGTKMEEVTCVINFKNSAQLGQDMASTEEVSNAIYSDKLQLRRRVNELRNPLVAAGISQKINPPTKQLSKASTAQSSKYPTGDPGNQSAQPEPPVWTPTPTLPAKEPYVSEASNEEATNSTPTELSETPLKLLSKRKQYNKSQGARRHRLKVYEAQ